MLGGRRDGSVQWGRRWWWRLRCSHNGNRNQRRQYPDHDRIDGNRHQLEQWFYNRQERERCHGWRGSILHAVYRSVQRRQRRGIDRHWRRRCGWSERRGRVVGCLGIQCRCGRQQWVGRRRWHGRRQCRQSGRRQSGRRRGWWWWIHLGWPWRATRRRGWWGADRTGGGRRSDTDYIHTQRRRIYVARLLPVAGYGSR